MTNRDLRRLRRSELLEMLIAQIEENERLKEKLELAEAELRERRLLIDRADSIADAALQLNGVLQAAASAASQYLENMRHAEEKEEGSSGE